MNIPFRQSPNYSTSTQKKIGWVFHGTLGAYKGAVDWLCNSNRSPRTSAHFVIGRNEGEVTQIVHVKDVAWHAGNVDNPNARAQKVLPKKMDGTWDNPNKYFVGIEFAWGYDVNGDGKITAIDKSLTEWQYKCVLAIIKMYENEIPINPDTILTHSDIASYKSDNLSENVQEVIKRLIPQEEMVNIPVPKSKVDKVLAYLSTI